MIKLAMTVIVGLLISRAVGVEEIDGATPRVGIIHLLIDPSEFDGKLVKVNGYLRNKSSTLYLFPSVNDALMRNYPVGIYVDVKVRDAQECYGQFVEIHGVFGLAGSGSFPGILDVHTIRKHNMDPTNIGKILCYKKPS